VPSVLARRYDDEQPCVAHWDAGYWTSVRRATPSELRAVSVAVEGLPYLAPGLVDLQINGYQGRTFTDPTRRLTVDDVWEMTRALAADGITSYCPTLTTHARATLLHGVAVIASAFADSDAHRSCFAGIHLEGPYISAEDGPRGAHPAEHCRAPDWGEFEVLQEAARGTIRIVTLSPEYPGACGFIERLVERGVLVAIGHTGAACEQIADAVSAGARLSTHLGNGAHARIRRHPNYIWEQLADDRLTASLIVDGHHLPPSVVRSFVRSKTAERCVLVSDITSLGGMPPGRYETGLGAVEVLDDGRLVVAGQREFLAGAARPMLDAIRNVMRFAGVGRAEAIDMASTRPARLVGAAVPRLEPGAPADFVLFDPRAFDADAGTDPPRVAATYRRGLPVYQANAS